MVPRGVVAALLCAAICSATDEWMRSKPDCKKAGDGYYVLGCSSKFWRCVNDHLYNYDCPKGLYFNPLKRKCEYKDDVEVCAQEKTARDVIKATAEFNCSGLADGPYKPKDIACSNTFITCYNGMAVEMMCPANQYFNEKAQACDHRENVHGCLKGLKISGRVNTNTEYNYDQVAESNDQIKCAPLAFNQSTIPCHSRDICRHAAHKDGRYHCEAPFRMRIGPVGVDMISQWKNVEGVHCGEDGKWRHGQEEVDGQWGIDCAAQRIDCSSRPDGVYTVDNKCHSNFWKCASGIAHIYSCPAGLFYDEEQKSCEYREFIIACGGKAKPTTRAARSTTSLPVTAAPSAPQPTPANTVAAADVPTDSFPSTDSYGRTYAPSSSPIQTPSPTPFPSSTTLPSTSLPLPSPGPLPAPSFPPQDVPDAVSPIAKEKKSFDCSSRPDGLYTQQEGECTKYFWKCANGASFLYACQKDLFFDKPSESCDFQQYVTACGGQRTTPAPTTQAPALDAISAFDCRGQADGYYAKDKCTPRFYQCSGGITSAIDCPRGLVYDSKKNLCEYENECQKAAEPTPSVPPQRDFVTPTIPQPAPVPTTKLTLNFECQGKNDGLYEIGGCRNEYVQCVSGTQYPRACQNGLVFNPRIQSCDFHDNCKKDASEPAPLPPPALPAQSPPSPPFPQPSSQPPVPAGLTTPSCAQLADGPHAMTRCGSQYFMCWKGSASLSTCGAELVYNPRNGQCDFRGNVAECAPGNDIPSSPMPTNWPSSIPPTAIPTAAPTQSYSSYPSTVPATPAPSSIPPPPPRFPSPSPVPIPTTSADVPQPTTPKVVESFCERQEDGFYGRGCQEHFFSCNNGNTYKMFCPLGLFYDPSNKLCERREVIVECGGTPPPKQTSPAPSIPFPSPTTPAQSPAVTSPIVLLDCTGKQDGIFGSACSSDFIHCVSGKAFPNTCKGGLVYNTENGYCDYRENVAGCGNDVLPTRAPEQHAPVAPIEQITEKIASAKESQQKRPKPQQDAVSVSSCAGLADGYYTEGCSSNYLACFGGNAIEMTCPAGLKYSKVTGMCDYADNVDVCGGGAPPAPGNDVPVTPAPTAFVTAAPRPQPLPQTPPMAPPTTPAPHSQECIGKADGIYLLHECAQSYLACVNGRASIGRCHGSLHYNAEATLCDYKENVRGCPEYRPPTTPRPQIAAAPVVQTEKPIQAPNTFDCSRNADGLYAADKCSSSYIRCVGGRFYSHGVCPSSLIFDEKKAQCDYREHLEVCGGKPPAPIEQPKPVPQQQAPPPPARDASGFCVSKPNGLYGNGCSRHYVVCTNGQSYPFSCQHGLVFNQDKSICDHPSNIRSCSAGQTPQAAPPAPQPQQSLPVPQQPQAFPQTFPQQPQPQFPPQSQFPPQMAPPQFIPQQQQFPAAQPLPYPYQ